MGAASFLGWFLDLKSDIVKAMDEIVRDKNCTYTK